MVHQPRKPSKNDKRTRHVLDKTVSHQTWMKFWLAETTLTRGQATSSRAQRKVFLSGWDVGNFCLLVVCPNLPKRETLHFYYTGVKRFRLLNDHCLFKTTLFVVSAPTHTRRLRKLHQTTATVIGKQTYLHCWLAAWLNSAPQSSHSSHLLFSLLFGFQLRWTVDSLYLVHRRKVTNGISLICELFLLASQIFLLKKSQKSQKCLQTEFRFVRSVNFNIIEDLSMNLNIYHQIYPNSNSCISTFLF